MPFRAPTDWLSIAVAIRNRNDELISDVQATVVHPDGEEVDPQAQVSYVDIGPGQDIDIACTFPAVDLKEGRMRIRLEFTDAAGPRWRRLGGALESSPAMANPLH